MYLRNLLLICILPTFIAACGGGGGSSSNATPGSPTNSGTPPAPTGGGTPAGPAAPTGIELEGGVSGTGLNFGSIQGFSSVIVNGLAMDTNSATILIEGQAASQAELEVGQTVAIIGDLETTTAVDLRYRADVKGPISALSVTNALTGAASLTVLGQQVATDATTLFKNTSLDTLTIGMTVAISGQRNASGVLVASFVERDDSLTTFKVVGIPSAVSATELQIGGLTVGYTNAVLENFAGNAITTDQVVEVRGAAADFTAPATLAANAVERLPALSVNAESEIELEGFITRYADADDFDVGGQPVAADASTQFDFGSAASLALNVRVEVEGLVDAAGVLVAQRISIRPTSAVRVEGPLEGVDLVANTVTALGLTFAVRTLTELEDDSAAAVNPLTLGDLSLGDIIELRGFLESDNLVAVELERGDFDPEARLRAPVVNADETAGTLELLDVTVTVDAASTEYEDADDNPITRAQFFNLLQGNPFVEARWDSFVSTGQAVDQLSIEDD